MHPARAQVAPGDRIDGRYEVEALLGAGGMAVVYRACHTGTRVPCALKLVHAHLVSRRELVDLFLKEARVGSHIGKSEHIVEVFDAGFDRERGVPYLAMELLEGETLEEWCERHGPMPPELVRALFEQLAEALDQAHKAGVVHRDLKPSNLFLTTGRRGRPIVKIMDFGIAKVLEAGAQRTATQVGTPAYAAPEQMGPTMRDLAARQGIAVAHNVSLATDVWPLALVAYELLTGLPSGQYWGAETAVEIPMKAVLLPREKPTSRAGDRAVLLPSGFDAWFLRTTSTLAEGRWASAGEACDELVRMLDPLAAPVVPARATAEAAPPSRSLTIRGAVAADLRPPTPVSVPKAPAAEPRHDGAASGPKPQAPAEPLAPRAAPSPSPAPPSEDAPGVRAPRSPATEVTWTGAPAAPPARAEPTFAPLPPPAQTRRRRPWIAVAAVAAVAAAVAATVVIPRLRTNAAREACRASGARCEEACDAGDAEGCGIFASRVERGDGVARDDGRAAKLYQRACDGGDPASCTGLGRMIQKGRVGKDKDPVRATALFKRGCDGGDPQGCAQLGEAYRDAQGGLARDLVRAVALFQSACDRGDRLGCNDLGGAFELGHGGLARDDKKAADLHQRACDAGLLVACSDLGVLVAAGRGRARDEKAAAMTFQRGCDLGDLVGCSHLGALIEQGRGGLGRDEARAVALYRRACEGGEPRGCGHLGAMAEAGKGGVPLDIARARALYEQACDAGDPAGCRRLGALYEYGKGGLARDEARAVALYRRACDGGDPRGCNDLGFMTENGKGGLARDDARVAELYERACDTGEPIGCANFGVMLAAGRGVARDEARAAALYQRACDAGNAAGCAGLGWSLFNGRGSIKERARGLDLLRKACDAGNTWACDRLRESGAR